MISIKKVEVQPLDINYGKIIDSFNTTDDKTKNSPSLNAVEQYVKSRVKILTYAGSTSNGRWEYPEGFNKDNTTVVSVMRLAKIRVTQLDSEEEVWTNAETGGENGTFSIGRVLLGDEYIYLNVISSSEKYKITIMRVD